MPVVPLSSAPVSMTEEQRFLFDLKGWILLPGVIERNLLEAIQTQLRRDVRVVGGGAAVYRSCIEGLAQELLDHPAVVGILREIIAADPAPDAYGFRCESSFFVYRGYGQCGFQPPHSGPIVGPLAYRLVNGQIYSGLTRIMWELTGVTQREGGTPIMSGSHKAQFDVPAKYRAYDPALYEGYTCPPGSAVIFTESCWHYGVEWKDTATRRLAVFNCYNHALSQFHRLNIDGEIVERMPAKRRTLFRGVWDLDVKRRAKNTYYDGDNRAL